MTNGEFRCVILGQPASAKNQRRIVKINGMPRLIKSKKALDYSNTFHKQCPTLDSLIEGDVSLQVDVWYSSRRPDLACIDLIQDLLQGHVYRNDRQVKASMSLWGLDKENPRCQITVKMLPQSSDSQELSSLPLSKIWA
jgi:Holliday junction resolvase RusA-like endonuclease